MQRRVDHERASPFPGRLSKSNDATPEYAHGYMTQCMLGTGVKHFLLEVSRQSKKRAMEACAKAELLAPQLVEWCCKEYGLTVEPTEIKFNVEGQK